MTHPCQPRGFCDFFAAWGPLTEGGRTLASRNLDFDKDTGVANHKLVTVYSIEGQHPYATFVRGSLFLTHPLRCWPIHAPLLTHPRLDHPCLNDGWAAMHGWSVALPGCRCTAPLTALLMSAKPPEATPGGGKGAMGGVMGMPRSHTFGPFRPRAALGFKFRKIIFRPYNCDPSCRLLALPPSPAPPALCNSAAHSLGPAPRRPPRSPARGGASCSAWWQRRSPCS